MDNDKRFNNSDNSAGSLSVLKATVAALRPIVFVRSTSWLDSCFRLGTRAAAVSDRGRYRNPGIAPRTQCKLWLWLVVDA